MSFRARLLLAAFYLTSATVLALSIPLALTVERRADSDYQAAVLGDAAILAARVSDLVVAATGPPNSPVPRLDRLVAESADARGQRVVVTDASGKVVADSAGTVSSGELYATSGRPEFRTALFQGRIDTRTRYSDTLGQDLLLVTVPVVDRGRVVGAVRLSAGTKVVGTAVRASWLRLALLGGVVIVAGVLVAWLLELPLGRQIRRLADASARLGQGDLAARAPEEGPARSAALNIAGRLDGRRLEGVEAVGKNLLLHFEGGVTLRSHLRMRGRWRVRPRGGATRGAPWLILRSAELEASQWNGPVLELGGDAVRRLGPDILERPPDLESMILRLRRASELPLAEALQRQQLVAGIGNMWAAEALWSSRLSPWLAVRDVSEEDLLSLLDETHRMMSAALESSRPSRRVYRRAGRPCRRCGTPIRSRGQGDANRTAYWCPTCQPISST